MEHPEGGSLLDLSANWNHIIPPHMVLSIAADILKALAYLHQKGLSFDHLRYENVWVFGCTSHAIQAKLLCKPSFLL
jgi:serine/threonine protein kinase